MREWEKRLETGERCGEKLEEKSKKWRIPVEGKQFCGAGTRAIRFRIVLVVPEPGQCIASGFNSLPHVHHV
jgi:hypothetical protein